MFFFSRKATIPKIELSCPNCDKICHTLNPEGVISSKHAELREYSSPFSLWTALSAPKAEHSTPPGTCSTCCHCTKPCHIVFTIVKENMSKPVEGSLTLEAASKYSIGEPDNQKKHFVGYISPFNTTNVRHSDSSGGIKLSCPSCNNTVTTLHQSPENADTVEHEVKDGNRVSFALELMCQFCGEVTHRIYAHPTDGQK